MIDLKLNHVSKRYRLRREVEGDASQHVLLRKLQSLRRRSEEFWAVRDVTFEVERGEALGIIGHNGAGKSTILKLLSNITAPTTGEITINGRLSALIEVGSGFHPELTGRENIFLNGSILGMRRREIAKKFDSIVDFAGVRQFIDTPVKRYSSGMYVRLGFSIAAHLDPDILLLDEVLAVGDAAFQAKCLRRITELKEAGTTIVFISHDLGAVERLCDRVVLMRRGEIAASGETRAVIAEYQRASADLNAPEQKNEKEALSDRKAKINAVGFYDAEGHELVAAETGGPLIARINYLAHEAVEDAVFELFFYTGNRELLCHLSTEFDARRLDLSAGAGIAEFSCAELGLKPVIYYADATIKQRGALDDLDWQRNCATLRVDPGKMGRGQFYMPHEWRVTQRGGRGERISETSVVNLLDALDEDRATVEIKPS
ncbi:MAG: ABC transporter ATP-binding protein [Acidobacteria bacterium]|nr:ABC transporter ATP-binding protein [Acidobacteriota bacterium]